MVATTLQVQYPLAGLSGWPGARLNTSVCGWEAVEGSHPCLLLLDEDASQGSGGSTSMCATFV